MENKDKQIKRLKKENTKLKAEIQELKSRIQDNEKSENELKIEKRKHEQEEWLHLLKRNTYKDEQKLIVRWWKNMWNVFGCILRFFLLKRKDMKGTHVAFLQKKTKASFVHSIISGILICGAIYIIAPNFCYYLNEWLKQYTWLTNYMLAMIRIVVVVAMLVHAKIHYLISGEIDNSNDEDFIENNTIQLSSLISGTDE